MSFRYRILTQEIFRNSNLTVLRDLSNKFMVNSRARLGEDLHFKNEKWSVFPLCGIVTRKLMIGRDNCNISCTSYIYFLRNNSLAYRRVASITLMCILI